MKDSKKLPEKLQELEPWPSNIMKSVSYIEYDDHIMRVLSIERIEREPFGPSVALGGINLCEASEFYLEELPKDCVDMGIVKQCMDRMDSKMMSDIFNKHFNFAIMKRDNVKNVMELNRYLFQKAHPHLSML